MTTDPKAQVLRHNIEMCLKIHFNDAGGNAEIYYKQAADHLLAMIEVERKKAVEEAIQFLEVERDAALFLGGTMQWQGFKRVIDSLKDFSINGTSERAYI